MRKKDSKLPDRCSRLTLGNLIAAILLQAGCSRAPTFNILGSFFPAWILCGLTGIVLTAVVRYIFVRTKFEQELSPLILVYPCLAALFTFTMWLIFFS
jgi:YtcA-like protein